MPVTTAQDALRQFADCSQAKAARHHVLRQSLCNVLGGTDSVSRILSTHKRKCELQLSKVKEFLSSLVNKSGCCSDDCAY